MSENLKTIKELADELGVSKDKIKYRVRKLPSELTTKVGGVTYLKNEAVERICKDMGVKTPTYSRVEKPTIPTENTHPKKEEILSIPTDFLLEELKKKDTELDNKNKQIDNLIETQKQTQNLLDQQQRLALQDKKLLEEYKAENDSLKALKMPSQETEFKHLDNQYKNEVNVLKEKLENLQEQIKDQKRIEEQEKPRKWWKFWK
ncbi:DNA-binding protein [Lactococcus lactis]|uniref:DNA-binding protein n=1 Tax=Lactococcus lactis TaxID=1358 RepID=UPI0018C5E613|nr:DNA-binding protein [Lactococcus lactis]MBG1277900.1 DNA-binding protein [Lactococcus lactis subsp. lactis]